MTQSTTSIFFASGYAAADKPSIHLFSLDETNGSMTSLGSFKGILDPSYILVHPNGCWLYAVSEISKDKQGSFGEVWAFRVETDPFSMQPVNRQTTRGDWPCHLQLDHTNSWLIATNYGTGNAAIYRVQADGLLGEMTDFVQHQGSGPNEARQEAPHAHSSIFTPDNQFVIIADLGSDQLVMYRLDAASGKLSPHTSVKARPGAGPRHLVFHPNGHWLYVANELNSTVTRYEYEAPNGTLSERQTVPTIPSDAPTNIVADIHMTPAGNRLYISNRGHNSLAVYDVDDEGNLSLVSMPSCGGNWPRNFAISPGGGFVLVANQYSNEVCALPILDSNEALGAPAARISVTGASSIQFVANG